MRITGTVLLIAGFFLCISVVWAAIGFLMMGWGLVCLLIAERRKKRSTAASGWRFDDVAYPIGTPSEQRNEGAPGLIVSDFDEAGTQAEPISFPQLPEPGLPEIADREPAEPPFVAPSARVPPHDPDRYDVARWRSLVTSNADISRSVQALAPFGKKYVDQFAMAYLAFNEEANLPTIMKMVAAAIRKDSGWDPAGVAAIENTPATDLNSFAISKVRGPALEQALASPSPKSVSERSNSIEKAQLATPKMDPGTTIAHQEGKTSYARSNKHGAEPLDARPSDTAPVRSVAARTAVEVNPDDARDLTDLLKRIA